MTEPKVQQNQAMAAPLVSVITPAHNAERFLPETIRSVQAQTYPYWEMWIVDDVSTDGDQVVVSGRGDLVQEVTAVLLRHEIPATDFRTRTATLDDAFLQLTGHELGEPVPAPEPKGARCGGA